MEFLKENNPLYRNEIDEAIKALSSKSYRSEARRWKRKYLKLKQNSSLTWISVEDKDKLPDTFQTVAVWGKLICKSYHSERFHDYGYNIGWRLGENWSTKDGFLIDVIAWAPLPEPYVHESGDKYSMLKDKIEEAKHILDKLNENDRRRLSQCILCVNDPILCGCIDTDEDENGMCKKYVERKHS